MGFETAPFGSRGTGNVTTVTDVSNHYNTRDSEGARGVVKTEGLSNEASFEFDGTDVGNGAFQLKFASKIPAGAIIEEAYVKVKEAFVLGGTTPVIQVGTEGSEDTNGVVISEAQAEATGTYDITSTLTGTWASPLAAETTVGLALDGTTPTVTAAGLAEVIVRYSVV